MMFQKACVGTTPDVATRGLLCLRVKVSSRGIQYNIILVTFLPSNLALMCGTCDFIGCSALCREALVSVPFPVVWIDNFSKNMARQIPRLGKDVFTSMMWTGLALKLYDGPQLSRDLVEVDGQVVDAMPPCHAPSKDDFVRLLSASLPVDAANPVPMRYSQSLVRRYNVNSIPPKADLAQDLDPEFHKRLTVSRDGLHRTLPWDLWQHNIGSNTGLIDVIKQYMASTNLETSSKYHVWLVDLNIYSRIYKVS